MRLDANLIAPEHVASALAEQRDDTSSGLGKIESYASYVAELLP